MKRLMVLGAGPFREGFFLAAQRLGVEAILVDDNPYDRYDRVARTYPWAVSDLSPAGDPGLRAVEELATTVDGVTTLSEWRHRTVSRLAEDNGLVVTGDPRPFEHKLAQRRLVADVSSTAVSATLASSAEDIRSFFAAGNRRAILKPADGAGSSGIASVSSAATAVAALPRVVAASRTGRAILEDFVEGTEFSIEVVVQDGTVRGHVVTEKGSTGPPYFVERQHVVFGDQRRYGGRDTADFVTRLVAALGVRNAVLHAEAKHTPSGWVLIEASPRPAGGMICELVRQSCGVDLYECQIRIALGDPVRHDDAGGWPVAGIRYVVGVGRTSHLDGLDPILRPYPALRSGAVMQEPGLEITAVDANWRRAGWVAGWSSDPAALVAELRMGAADLQRALGLHDPNGGGPR